MVDWAYYWNTYFWLWMALLAVLFFAFLWAFPLRAYRERQGLVEFKGTLPEPQLVELRERLAEEFERGLIDRGEYERRVSELERPGRAFPPS